MKVRGQFPSDKCNAFVNCWDNDVTEQYCPPGLAFSSKGYCDFEGNVDCNGLPVADVPVSAKPEESNFVAPSVQPQQTVPSAVPSVQPPSVALVPSSSTVQPAAPSAQPSQPLGQPQPTVPSNTQQPSVQEVPSPSPNSLSSPSPSSPAPQPVPGKCNFSSLRLDWRILFAADPALKAKCLKARGQFPTDVCNRYINCWDDAVREEECPKGMAFSEKGYCDYDFSVNCGNRTYERSKK